jgi:uncharacterized protein (DUF58 family)
MKRIYKQFFFSQRFLIIAGGIIVAFALSFVLSWLFPVAQIALAGFVAVTVADILILSTRNRKLFIERELPSLMSLGSENPFLIKVRNDMAFKVDVQLYDELPYQLQKRDFSLHAVLQAGEERSFDYHLVPTKRGKYLFGNVIAMVSSPLGLVQQKQENELSGEVPVYPSIIQMKKLELKAMPLFSKAEGVKKLRRLGHSYEFEQIKEYVIGDDSRTINWKASGRRSNLMVNQYEDERSQQVYSIIDKGRTMRMPFNGLTLLDHSINSSLVISNVVLQKHDKAGLITFSDKIGTIIPAERKEQQLRKILEALYNEQENFLEAEYDLLYHLVRNIIKNRSLIFLYTNFESLNAFERVVPVLRRINKLHLLVVVLFDNEEVVNMSKQTSQSVYDIYAQTLARTHLSERNQMFSGLANLGIHYIKTLPRDLSVNTINKYLELKSRGMI